MIEQYAQSLAHFLQTNPNWGGALTFLIAFLESLVIIGTIIPGSVTMTAIGMLIGAAILPFWTALGYAAIGAFLGDLLGYWLGWFYNERLRSMWPFKKYPQWLETGENFFHKHGGKSIVIGRFMGPLRSIIPMIAGLLHMPISKFILAVIPTAFLWALAYLLPGIILGAFSTQLPANIATKFSLILLGSILAIAIFAWLIKLFSAKLNLIVRYYLKKWWQYLEEHKKYQCIITLLATKNKSEEYKQLGLALTAIVTFLLFVIVTVSVFEHSGLTDFNRPLFEFLRSTRNIKTDKFMIALTLLGDGRVLILSSALIFCLFVWQRKFYVAWHWLLAILIGSFVPVVFKYFFYFPRPTGLLHASSTSSFPSGHTFIALLYYGFTANLIANNLYPRYKHYVYYAVCTLISLIALSRLYLGAHWLTDILGSILLGSTSLALLTISYRKREIKLEALETSFVITAITLILACIFFSYTYRANLYRYSLHWPSQIITANTWWGQVDPSVPIYRTNRLGKPDEPMNIQYSGNISQLKQIFLVEGWQDSAQMTLIKTTIKKLSTSDMSITPLLPALYLNKAPLLMLSKDIDNHKLILKLWRSNVYISESWDVIYVGSITEYQITSNEKIIYSFNVIPKILPYLKATEWRLALIKVGRIPEKLFRQKWNGQILQISAPALY